MRNHILNKFSFSTVLKEMGFKNKDIALVSVFLPKEQLTALTLLSKNNKEALVFQKTLKDAIALIKRFTRKQDSIVYQVQGLEVEVLEIKKGIANCVVIKEKNKRLMKSIKFLDLVNNGYIKLNKGCRYEAN